jgi:hypothetical protein
MAVLAMEIVRAGRNCSGLWGCFVNGKVFSDWVGYYT